MSESQPISAPVSAVLITRDAAALLPACLDRLHFCAEIVVVDAGSSDATCALAASAGARVLTHPWGGFGPQKQFAVQQARYDHVLCIDSDEQVSPDLAASISAALAAWPADVAGYRMARCNLFMGRALRHGEGYPDWNVRLFDRRLAGWSDDLVHESVQVRKGRVATLQGDLWHDSAHDLETYIAKQNHYSSVLAQTALARGEQAHLLQLVFSPLLRFIKYYLLRAGFLDGVPGLVHSLIGCQASFAKYAKMLARQRSAANHP